MLAAMYSCQAVSCCRYISISCEIVIHRVPCTGPGAVTELGRRDQSVLWLYTCYKRRLLFDYFVGFSCLGFLVCIWAVVGFVC